MVSSLIIWSSLTYNSIRTPLFDHKRNTTAMTLSIPQYLALFCALFTETTPVVEEECNRGMQYMFGLNKQ